MGDLTEKVSMIKGEKNPFKKAELAEDCLVLIHNQLAEIQAELEEIKKG